MPNDIRVKLTYGNNAIFGCFFFLSGKKFKEQLIKNVKKEVCYRVHFYILQFIILMIPNMVGNYTEWDFFFFILGYLVYLPSYYNMIELDSTCAHAYL